MQPCTLYAYTIQQHQSLTHPLSFPFHLSQWLICPGAFASSLYSFNHRSELNNSDVNNSTYIIGLRFSWSKYYAVCNFYFPSKISNRVFECDSLFFLSVPSYFFFSQHQHHVANSFLIPSLIHNLPIQHFSGFLSLRAFFYRYWCCYMTLYLCAGAPLSLLRARMWMEEIFQSLCVSFLPPSTDTFYTYNSFLMILIFRDLLFFHFTKSLALIFPLLLLTSGSS